ncbi:MAG: hypothetical protein AAF594_14600 [Bacteroidota bacterium]
MRYDLSLDVNPCAHCGRLEYEAWAWNGFTWNLSPMMDLAFAEVPEAGGPAEGARWTQCLRGLSGEDAEPLVRSALQAMSASPDEFRALRPSNGWGTYSGAVRMLSEMLDAFQGWPEAVVVIR